MYDQIREDTLFAMFYGGVTFMALMASCYLLFRRANALAPDITPPARLRKWTGLYLASIALNHVWYLPLFFKTSSDDILMTELIGGVLDSLTVFPFSIVILFAMLQDHQRPLWPIAVMTVPISLGIAVCVATRSDALYPAIYAYVLLMGIGLIIYMVRATRQYGRWLRDNYADLEHKEVWQSFIVLAILLIVYLNYEFSNDGPVYMYAMQVICVMLICYLLWRVETLSELNIPANNTEVTADDQGLPAEEPEEDNAFSLSIRNNIGPLLKQHCEEPQLFLQYNISVTELAKLIGTNRAYLSKHFAMQGTTYNDYINGLRIQHFINLYHEAVSTHQPVTAQQLAHQSGFRSYNTFSVAFKKVTGMTATEWMRLTKL